MRKNDFLEIKQLEYKSIVAKILAAKKEVAELVLDKNMHKLKDTKVISKKRKDIAQMQTIANQKKMLESLATSDKSQVTSTKEKTKNKKEKKGDH